MAPPAGPLAGMPVILVNGLPAASIPADDRGCAYGDGVFRTLAMYDGRVPAWDRHYAKLAADCRALGISPPLEPVLRTDLQQIAREMPDCALRITVTRGSGGRGYALPAPATPLRMVSASSLPAYPENYASCGVAVRYCTLRLAAQPRLAGIKHLNRLENVLARAEWSDPAIAEGLLCDESGAVIEGTRSNLFMVEGACLVTPELSRCGVSGVTRETLLELAAAHGMPCRIDTVSRERLEAADEVMLVNSLIGIWPVARLEQRTWTQFHTAVRLRQWLEACRDASA